MSGTTNGQQPKTPRFLADDPKWFRSLKLWCRHSIQKQRSDQVTPDNVTLYTSEGSLHWLPPERAFEVVLCNNGISPYPKFQVRGGYFRDANIGDWLNKIDDGLGVHYCPPPVTSNPPLFTRPGWDPRTLHDVIDDWAGSPPTNTGNAFIYAWILTDFTGYPSSVACPEYWGVTFHTSGQPVFGERNYMIVLLAQVVNWNILQLYQGNGFLPFAIQKVTNRVYISQGRFLNVTMGNVNRHDLPFPNIQHTHAGVVDYDLPASGFSDIVVYLIYNFVTNLVTVAWQQWSIYSGPMTPGGGTSYFWLARVTRYGCATATSPLHWKVRTIYHVGDFDITEEFQYTTTTTTTTP